jgi:hypothetical protein
MSTPAIIADSSIIYGNKGLSQSEPIDIKVVQDSVSPEEVKVPMTGLLLQNTNF